MADKALIKKLIEKLKVGDGRNIHVNAMPNSVSKIDIFDFANIEASLHLLFLKNLLTKITFDFNFSLSAKIIESKNIEEKKVLRELSRKLNYVYYQNIDEYEEHGIKTFGFGYPLLIKKDKLSGKIIKSPIFIWYLDLKKDTSKSDAWIISRTEDHPMIVNEVLASQIYQQDNITWDDILPEEEELCTEKTLSEFCTKLLGKYDAILSENDKIVKLMPCTNNESLDVLTTDTPWIRWSGVLGQYKTQKQSIIHDLESLASLDDESELETGSPYLEGVDLPVMPLDSGQEGILDYLESKNRIVIQGPPGTGKSQTLTAIIAHALQNSKNVLVVCEKKTAMDVLYNNLYNLGLQEECLQIEDIFKDRKRVVELARKWLDEEEVSEAPTFKEQDFNFLQAQYFAKKEELNFRLNMASQKIFGDDSLLELIIKVKKLNSEYAEHIKVQEPTCDYEEFLNKSQYIYEASKQFVKIIYDETKLSMRIFYEEKSDVIIHNKFSDIYLKIKELYELIKINTLKYGANFYVLNGLNNFKLSIGSILSSSLKDTRQNQYLAIEKYRHLFPLLSSKSILNVDFPNPDTLTSLQLLEAPLQQASSALGELMDNPDIFSKYISYECYLQQHNLSLECHQLSNIPPERWQNIYIKSYFTYIINQYFVANSIKEDTLKLLEEFVILEDKIKILTRQKIIKLGFDRRKNALENKDRSKLKYLYNLRKNKQYSSRNSLRNIIHSETTLFQAFFPVLMVSPSVCSSVLPLQKGLYDLLIMDEASQLKLEDTYAALYRGKIHLISGDKHQMPPSGFFSAVLQYSNDDGEISDEEAIWQYLADSKSLLEYAEDKNYFQHYLDFHYRSRNPQLIDFSNHSFYNSRLIPLPPQKPYQAIYYHYVDGKYSDNVNEEEADTIATLLYDRYALTDYSIGIATFNLLQRNLVWNILWKKAYESDSHMKILESHLQKGLFVKNLENIQGDERDVILLSTTFGKDTEGKFRQNFGPLNTQKGYQLLNVIITRAKHFLHVLTSIPLPDPNVLEDTLKSNQFSGKAVVYAYLYYARAVHNRDEVAINWILNVMRGNNTYVNKKNETNSLISDIQLIDFDKYKECNLTFGGYNLDLKSDEKVWDVGISQKQMLPTRAYRNLIHRRNILKNFGINYQPFLLYNWWIEKN
jgi:hypothetical protein